MNERGAHPVGPPSTGTPKLRRVTIDSSLLAEASPPARPMYAYHAFGATRAIERAIEHSCNAPAFLCVPSITVTSDFSAFSVPSPCPHLKFLHI